jgi:hypothetical protein
MEFDSVAGNSPQRQREHIQTLLSKVAIKGKCELLTNPESRNRKRLHTRMHL